MKKIGDALNLILSSVRTYSKLNSIKPAIIFMEKDVYNEKKRPFNDLGVWLMQKLNYWDVGSKDLANRIKSTLQNVSDFLRGNRFGSNILQRWKRRFENVLSEMDEKRTNDLAATIVYRAICTNVMIEGNMYTVYGIQMLSGTPGNYVIVDEIQDITIQADQIYRMVELFNDEKVAAVHFRDVVMDSIV